MLKTSSIRKYSCRLLLFLHIGVNKAEKSHISELVWGVVGQGKVIFMNIREFNMKSSYEFRDFQPKKAYFRIREFAIFRPKNLLHSREVCE